MTSCETNNGWKQTTTEYKLAPIERVQGVLLESRHWSHHLHCPLRCGLWLTSQFDESQMPAARLRNNATLCNSLTT